MNCVTTETEKSLNGKQVRTAT